MNISKKNIKDILPLSSMQESMLYNYLHNPENDNLHEQISFMIEGEIDHDIFQKSWSKVVELNDSLRSIFFWNGIKKPIQIILKENELDFSYKKLDEGITDEQVLISTNSFKIKDKENKFILDKEVPFRVCLLKIKEQSYFCLISNHHIIYDGWSNSVIINEFLSIYKDHVVSCDSNINKKGLKVFVKNTLKQRTDEIEPFWKGYFNNINQKYYFIKKSYGQELAFHKISFEKSFQKKVFSFSKTNYVSFANIIYTAWAILLSKYTYTDDVVFDVAHSGRNNLPEGKENVVGMFMNTLPLRIKLDYNEKLQDAINATSESNYSVLDFESSPIQIAKKYSPSINKSFIYGLCVIENYPINKSLFNSSEFIKLHSFSFREQTVHDITLVVSLLNNEFTVEICYNSKVISLPNLLDLAKNFQFILSEIIESPELSLRDLELPTDLENRKDEVLIDLAQKLVPKGALGKIYSSVKNCNGEEFIELWNTQYYDTEGFGFYSKNGSIEILADIAPSTSFSMDINTSGFSNSACMQKLSDIWKSELSFTPGIYDNFFEIGGDSIMLISLFEKIRKTFPNKVQINDLFSNPTIFELTQIIEPLKNNDKEKAIDFIEF